LDKTDFARVAEQTNSMSANKMRSPIERDFPANGLPRQKLEFALKYAELAPTESQWPPWDFWVSDTCLDLIAKDDPSPGAVDPDGREALIGCGAALLYLKIALKHFGCLGRVALFPDLGDPALVARIYPGFGGEQETRERLLFEAMAGSRDNLSTPGDNPVSETMLAALGHAAAGERGWLDFVQRETNRQVVEKITMAGQQWSMTFDLSRAQPTKIEMANRPTRLLAAFGGRSPRPAIDTVQPAAGLAATLAVVKTKTDDKHGWLEAGQTMARTILQAQALGLSWAFFNSVRRREARSALRMGVGHKGFAQIILRFGSLLNGEMLPLAAPATASLPQFIKA
jgi:hypothetical protein